MSKNRIARINAGVTNVLGEILRNVKDPRIQNDFVTINSAEVSKDLKWAKVYFGCIEGDPKEIAEGLKSASGFMRRELAERLNLRITPALTFIHDTSAEYGQKIATMLKRIDEEQKEAHGEEE